MRTYQTVVIIDSLLKSEEIDAIIEKTVRNINNNGGKIVTIDRWEKKRLMYEIKKRQYGYYVEIVFEAPHNLIKILERDYRLDENILRYLTVHLDSKALAHRDKQNQKQAESAATPVPEANNNTTLVEEVNDFMPLAAEEEEPELVPEIDLEK